MDVTVAVSETPANWRVVVGTSGLSSVVVASATVVGKADRSNELSVKKENCELRGGGVTVRVSSPSVDVIVSIGPVSVAVSLAPPVGFVTVPVSVSVSVSVSVGGVGVGSVGVSVTVGSVLRSNFS